MIYFVWSNDYRTLPLWELETSIRLRKLAFDSTCLTIFFDSCAVMQTSLIFVPFFMMSCFSTLGASFDFKHAKQYKRIPSLVIFLAWFFWIGTHSHRALFSSSSCHQEQRPMCLRTFSLEPVAFSEVQRLRVAQVCPAPSWNWKNLPLEHRALLPKGGAWKSLLDFSALSAWTHGQSLERGRERKTRPSKKPGRDVPSRAVKTVKIYSIEWAKEGNHAWVSERRKSFQKIT